MLLKGDEGGVQNLEGVALRVTGTVPLPLGDPSTQRSMNRVVAQQELERQNFRVCGSGGDAVFRPAARWLRPPFPVTVRLTQGIMTPHPPTPKMTQGVMTPLTPPSSPSTASLSGVARCWHTLIFRYFLRYFSSTHRTDLSRFRGTFHSFDPVGFAIFAILRASGGNLSQPEICHYLSALRHREVGDHADQCLPIILYLHRLRRDAAAEAGRLLRVLFLRLGSMPADPGRAFG